MTVEQARRVSKVARRMGILPLTVALIAGYVPGATAYVPNETEREMLSHGKVLVESRPPRGWKKPW